jgi:hypothetical protein
MVLFKFAKFCLLENFNKMDIIRTFTKITNSFILKLTGPVHIIKRPSLFYVSIEMPAHVVCFDVFVIFLILIYLTKLLMTA